MSKISIFIVLLSLGLLAACGKKAVPAASVPEGPPVVPVMAPKGPVSAGQKVFDRTCALCHGAGVGGAPRPGDKAAWAGRVEKDRELLYKHAIEGFNGAFGYMPPRGGYPQLTDAEVKAGVDYMVEKSR